MTHTQIKTRALRAGGELGTCGPVYGPHTMGLTRRTRVRRARPAHQRRAPGAMRRRRAPSRARPRGAPRGPRAPPSTPRRPRHRRALQARGRLQEVRGPSAHTWTLAHVQGYPVLQPAEAWRDRSILDTLTLHARSSDQSSDFVRAFLHRRQSLKIVLPVSVGLQS